MPTSFDMQRFLDGFANSHKSELCEIYEKALRFSKMPRLDDCERDFRRLALENDVAHNLINDRSFMMALHLKAREFHNSLGRSASGANKLQSSSVRSKPSAQSVRASAASFAAANSLPLAEIFRKAKQHHSLPRLTECMADYKMLALKAGVENGTLNDIEFLRELHLHARSFFMGAKEKKADVARGAFVLANENREQLSQIYARAKESNSLPSLKDCRNDYATLARENGAHSELIDDDEYLQVLHLQARQYFSEGVRRRAEAERERTVVAEEMSKLLDALSQHGATLYSRVKRSVRHDPYGVEISSGAEEEITNFLSSQGIGQSLRAESYLELIAECRNNMTQRDRESASFSLREVQQALVSGEDFELWVSKELRKSGWHTSNTAATGDQGVDIIARKDGMRIAIQCKYYSGGVGNKAVQEVFAGMRHLGLDHAAVISTGSYTRSAIELARTTGVYLLGATDISVLHELLEGSLRR